MSEEMFRIILLVIPVVCAIITGYVVPFLRTKISNDQLAKIEYWAKKVVECAEQIYKHGDNETKKKFCFNFVEKMNNTFDWGLSPEQINILIESAVNNLK